MGVKHQIATMALGFVFLFGSRDAKAQSSKCAKTTPHGLVEFLTFQCERPDKMYVEMGLSGCGVLVEEQEAFHRLVQMGAAAVPELERAFDLLEARGWGSEFRINAGRLFDAYAQIKGTSAAPRLRKMISNPALAFLGAQLDRAMAVALHFTSYASASALRTVGICEMGAGGPRVALNQVVRAWAANNREWFEAALAPDAASALARAGGWTGVRSALRPSAAGSSVAVGYTFRQETARDKTARNLDTVFSNESGRECGAYRVRMAAGPGVRGNVPPPRRLMWLVGNPDVDGLLRVISACMVTEK
jgi:hypothetical protein